MELHQILNAIHPLSSEDFAKIQIKTREISLPKGHLIIRRDKIERSIYFVKKGIVRAYANMKGNEVTFWFGIEGDPVLSMKSYVSSQLGYEDIELLEDCDFYEIKSQALQSLFQNNIQIANWGRKFAEEELIKTEERLIAQQFKNAKERYLDLLSTHADLIQRVQLGHIASYLGITQVSLSRIRSEIR